MTSSSAPSDVATPAMLRALRYVSVLSSQGVRCTHDDLAAFADATIPFLKLWDNYEWEIRYDVMTDHHYEPTNTVGEYLLQVRWVQESDGYVELTKLGRAIAASSGNGALNHQPSPVINIALKGNDPLSYVAFLDAIQRVGGGSAVMLIDPYLPSKHVQLLMDDAGVNRVLTTDVAVSDVKESRAARTRAFGLLLGARKARGLEIKYAQKGTIHDRLVIPAKGTGLMMGRSLGGRQMTAVVELNDDLTRYFREIYTLAWSEAKAVTAIDLSHVEAEADA
jgi:hypothetical protein